MGHVVLMLHAYLELIRWPSSAKSMSRWRLY